MNARKRITDRAENASIEEWDTWIRSSFRPFTTSHILLGHSRNLITRTAS
ncbi:hypothetical protein GWN63_02230 [Candidatus Bathyarchaeota archaeon]|nr:hypothetical protein [Candidatus Bathyarchaeota archaeon]NIU81052.1 hypothetical protein [Candidatus Bathyarchaeota archaeon]NIV67960.1 hypothetical protein [Candidatus Bathyarchaeota archaeon]NIW34512.1 hypothetical protein [Candidatus Bathyarchaeota archaeon]